MFRSYVKRGEFKTIHIVKVLLEYKRYKSPHFGLLIVLRYDRSKEKKQKKKLIEDH
jgi:hypothetical protein